MADVGYLVKDMLEAHFKKKIENFNFYDDIVTESKVDELIDHCIEDIVAKIDSTEMEIDYELENFNEREAKNEYFTNLKIDERYQDEVEKRFV